MASESVVRHLRARGVIAQTTNDEGLDSLLQVGSQAVYIGFDPTARSLHLGHLLPILVLAHFQRDGHRPIVVVGGATGMIGDPSGRSSERSLLTSATVAENAEAIKRQISKFIEFDGPTGAVMLDNHEWIAPKTHLEWLRDVGKYFTVNYMLAKESVRRRFEDREEGISYTEFSYMLLQAYDFLYLRDKCGCRIQGGGMDQWGNITAGADLIRKVRAEEAFGFVLPLVTTSSGEKIGKSAGNAIWLDSDLTSPYRFYQYWVNSEDRDVESMLRLFTFLPLEEVGEIALTHAQNPARRHGQRTLAAEVTKLVHGEAALATARRASEVLFGGDPSELTQTEIEDVFSDVPSSVHPIDGLGGRIGPLDLLALSGLVQSRGEARRMIEGGGVYVNGKRLALGTTVSSTDLLPGGVLIVRSGKKNFRMLRFH